MVLKIIFILTFVLSNLSSNEIVNYFNENTLKKVLFFNYVIKNFYVEDIDNEEILNKTFKNYLNEIDPHSTYFSKEKYQEFKKNIDGDFVGVGIITSMKNNQLLVVTPIKNSPAFKVGIKSKDIIKKINDIDISNKDTLYIEKLIKGEKNTNVKLTIDRNNKELIFNIKRDNLIVHPIKDELISINDKKILFITIHLFNKLSYNDFKKTILKYKNYNGIVIDLRNNPGGLLTDSLDIADLFLDRNKILLFERTKNEIKKHFSKTMNIIPKNIPLGIIINNGSASGSEILAGILQDYKRAIIVGETSFGKGSVQQIIPVNIGEQNLGAIKLTTSRYYLPSKRSIQNNGIIPNILISNDNQKEHKDNTENSYKNSLKNVELKLTDNENKYLKTPEDTSKYFEEYNEDKQLKSTLSLIYSLIH